MKVTKAQYYFLLELQRSPRVPEGSEWIVSRKLQEKGLIEKRAASGARYLTQAGSEYLKSVAK